MLDTNATTFDSMSRFDRAHSDARRPPEARLPLPLWQRDRLFLLAWMFHTTGLKPKPSTTLISEAIVEAIVNSVGPTRIG